MKLNLDEIFNCGDQSALIDNYVSSEDPPPGAWSHHATPQSPLGRASFPEVLTIVRGDVLTREGAGRVTEHMLTEHAWLPWRYSGDGETVSVTRAVSEDIWSADVKLHSGERGMLLLECAISPQLATTFDIDENSFCIHWNDFHVWVIADGRMLFSDDPASLKRLFAGFDDVPLNPKHLSWVVPYLRTAWIGILFEEDAQVGLRVVRGSVEKPHMPSIAAMVASEKARWDKFFTDQAPPYLGDDKTVRDAYYFAWVTFRSNRCSGGTASLPGPFTSPARLHYGSQWWWDSAFHTVALGYLDDKAACYGELENLWRKQLPSGSTPGAIRFSADVTTDLPGMTLPPVIGFIMMRLREKPGWPDDLLPLYNRLFAYAEWLMGSESDRDRDGLAEFDHCHSTGSDQSSRWDNFKHDPAKTMDTLYPVAAVDLNVWVSELWRVLAQMAEEMGDANAAARHLTLAEAVFAKMDHAMWDATDGIYYDINGATREQNRVKSHAAFMPLLSPFANREKVERLVREHLLNAAEFWTQYPVPSVAIDEPKFDPIDMFRGPSWVNFNWMIVEGLHRQGMDDIAKELARRTVEMVGSRWADGRRVRTPRLFEWYQPFTGQPLGNSQYSWSAALTIDLVQRFLPAS